MMVGRCLHCGRELGDETPVGYVQVTGWQRVSKSGKPIPGQQLKGPKPTGKLSCFGCGFVQLSDQLQLEEEPSARADA